MIKINLLPFKRKKASTLTKDIRDLILMLLVVCIGFVAYYYFKVYTKIEEQKANIASTKQEIARLQPIQKEYNEIKEAKKEIVRRIQTVNQLKSGRALAARSLYDISSIIKEGVWIKNMKKTDNKFEIEGRSFVNENISDFIESLSKMAYIKNVELKNVQDVSEEGLIIKKFIITGNMSI
jgi:Tfp pilus assembly protein PilN